MKKVIFLLVVISLIVFSCSRTHFIELRKVIPLNGEWNFKVDSLNIGEKEDWQNKPFLSTSSKTVIVPHTWNVENGLERYWGKAWYSKIINIPTEYKGKITRIQFDAVYHDAIIWINGQKAGEHKGSGYTRFYIDATKYMWAGKANRVTVEVDNSSTRSNIPFKKSYDWANDGGIIRNVSLIVTEKQAIENVLISTVPDLQTGTSGLVKMNIIFLKNEEIDLSKVEIQAEIKEENQKTAQTIWKGKITGIINGSLLSCELKMDNIKLWHFDYPNLYTAAFQLIYKNEVKDNYTTTFGFRTISYTKEKFLFNGEPIRIMGVEWMPGSSLEHGMAETNADLEKNLKLLKNVNCIYTRFHWQQSQYVLDWADRHGLLIQEEIPYWGGETMINDTLLALGKQQLDEMISDHFNHPSVITWGIGNELDSHNPVNIESLKKLFSYAKERDSSRLVNYVSNRLNYSLKKNKGVLPDATANADVMMFNEYYSTWYGKTVDAVPAALEQIHEEYPDKPLVISEWGLCEPVHKGGDIRRCHEMKQQIAIYSSKPYVAGAIYFCLNDYRTHMGEDFTYSYPQRVHGVVDIHLKPKPSYDTLKMISSPLFISKIEKDNKKIIITIEASTGIPSYTIRNYKVSIGKNEQVLTELKPGESKSLEFFTEDNNATVTVTRPTGFEVLTKEIK